MFRQPVSTMMVPPITAATEIGASPSMTDTTTRFERSDFQSDQEVRWCPGCGDYTILASVQNYLATLDVDREKAKLVGTSTVQIAQAVRTAINGSKATAIRDGTDEFGDRLARGVYLYRVELSGPQGTVASDVQRLVVMR